MKDAVLYNRLGVTGECIFHIEAGPPKLYLNQFNSYISYCLDIRKVKQYLLRRQPIYMITSLRLPVVRFF